MYLLDYALIVAITIASAATMLLITAIIVITADPRSARTRDFRYTCIEEMRLRTRANVDEESLRASLLRASWFVSMRQEESTLKIDGWMREMGSLATPFRFVVSHDGECIVIQSCVPRFLVVAVVANVVAHVLLFATLISKELVSSSSGVLMPLAVVVWALFVRRELRKRLRPMRQHIVIYASNDKRRR